MKIAIFSDQHLGLGQSAKREAFFKLLQRLRSDCDELWLLGDVFDLFIGHFSFWRKEYQEIFEELQKWRSSGKRVLWIEGNHDFHIKAHLDFLDIEHSVEEVLREIPGPNGQTLKVYLAHGDLVDQEDHAYLKWRAFIRHPLFVKTLLACPEPLAQRLLLPMAQKLSVHSRQRDTPNELPQVKERFRRFALEKLGSGYSAVVIGHSHVFDFLTQDSGFFLNLGSWYESSLRYAVWEPKKSRNPEILVYN